MILSDRTITERLERGDLKVTPLADNAVQPASVDLRLDARLLIVPEEFWAVRYCLEPGQFILGSTVEWVEIPADLVGRLEGKSSLARLGLVIHSTAGFIDPGFRGNITLELSNVSDRAIWLQSLMPIGQISFTQMTTPAMRPYGTDGLGSHYQGQTGATPSWIAR